jgi:hypothetical protein
MARFYFSLLKGADIAEDLEGTELPGLQEAKVMARRTLRELIADAVKSGSAQSVEAVAISDESGKKLVEIAARDVLPESLK